MVARRRGGRPRRASGDGEVTTLLHLELLDGCTEEICRRGGETRLGRRSRAGGGLGGGAALGRTGLGGGGREGIGRRRRARRLGRRRLGFSTTGCTFFCLLYPCEWRSPHATLTEPNRTHSHRRADPAKGGTHMQPEAGNKCPLHGVS
jgi:hypothetical protein